MKIKFLFFLSIIGTMCLTSCGVLKSYTASYSVGLSSVESPSDAKQQFGETKVINFTDDKHTKYRYEDDYIDIVWYVLLTSGEIQSAASDKISHSRVC